jgi:hypothetical protein
MSNTLADTLSAMAREVADAPTLNGERANAWGRLSNCVAANLPAILAALREREVMRAAAIEFRDAVSSPIPTGPTYYAWVDRGRAAREKLDAALSGGGDA